MPNVNRVTVCGHLGRDPESRYTGSGTAVATLSVATSEKWKDRNSGDQQERTEWHRVTVWGKSAEYVTKYARKGSALFVEGKLQTRKWQDRDGNDRYTTEIVASDVHILTPKGSGGQQEHTEPETAAAPSKDEDDDIPF